MQYSGFERSFVWILTTQTFVIFMWIELHCRKCRNFSCLLKVSVKFFFGIIMKQRFFKRYSIITTSFKLNFPALQWINEFWRIFNFFHCFSTMNELYDEWIKNEKWISNQISNTRTPTGAALSTTFCKSSASDLEQIITNL